MLRILKQIIRIWIVFVFLDPLVFAQTNKVEAAGVKSATYKLNDGDESLTCRLTNGRCRKQGALMKVEKFFSGETSIAVILSINGGGSGIYMHLVVLDKAFRQVSQQYLGDRVVIENVEIGKDGTVLVTGMFHLPDDPLCCPSDLQTRRFMIPSKKLTPKISHANPR